MSKISIWLQSILVITTLLLTILGYNDPKLKEEVQWDEEIPEPTPAISNKEAILMLASLKDFFASSQNDCTAEIESICQICLVINIFGTREPLWLYKRSVPGINQGLTSLLKPQKGTIKKRSTFILKERQWEFWLDFPKPVK